MKKKLILTLFFVTTMLVVFTGCEPASSLPEIIANVKGYNNETIALLLPQVVGHPYDYYSADSCFTVDEGITCTVVESDVEDTTFAINLDNWVASDGAIISGYVSVDVVYYASSGHISNINTNFASLYYDRTSVSYVAEVLDGDASNEAFTPRERLFVFISLIVDGETLMFNFAGL